MQHLTLLTYLKMDQVLLYLQMETLLRVQVNLNCNCEANTHGINNLTGAPHSAGADYTLTLPNDAG